MSDIAIHIEHLGKQYRIGKRETHRSLREALSDALAAPARAFSAAARHSPPGSADSIWALDDITFDVKGGEVVGIIGRNGSGKSTLLKILSRITLPTRGLADIYGRVGSLLEVGTGFHPELTGRENLYLNGAILGMKKAEIDRRFDEIVAFSEVEKFLDTPVKHYSSGMYMRLAFSVAAHLEPEILVVDEVLAVGDAAFQKKCLGKMGDVAKTGRTVLFVSHNMGAIAELCQRAILLDHGRIVEMGEVNGVVRAYLSSVAEKAESAAIAPPEVDKGVTLQRVAVYDDEMRNRSELDYRYPFRLRLDFNVTKPISQLSPWLSLTNQYGVVVFTTWIDYQQPYEPGHYTAVGVIPGQLLTPGSYYVSVGAEHYRVEAYHYAPQCLSFDIINTDPSFDGTLPGWGVIHPKLDWHIQGG
ncbi:MAG: ABC transporter ATP-binding protein [Chloroflexi bacterium]|nr:ABC transporter ATP-binding protein [Chloroflexota bacterium]MBI4314609.1 ABC transporter ATP-binding protein [Chloroflexota bacterium]